MSVPTQVTPPGSSVVRGQRLSGRPAIIGIAAVAALLGAIVLAVTTRGTPSTVAPVAVEETFDLSPTAETRVDFLRGKPFGIVDPQYSAPAAAPALPRAAPEERDIEGEVAAAIERQRIESLDAERARREAERARRDRLIERQLQAAEAALVAPLDVAGFGVGSAADGARAEAARTAGTPGGPGGRSALGADGGGRASTDGRGAGRGGAGGGLAATAAGVAGALRPDDALAGAPGRFRLNESVRAPETPYELKTGTLLPGMLVSAINSDLPGSIVAQVAQNVYDTESGRYLLIPQGSRLFGRYDAFTQLGQERLLVVWERLIFPDAESLDLRGMQGYDDRGLAGLADRVNTHFLRTLANAFLLSVVSGAGDELASADGADTSLVLNIQSEFGNTATGALEAYLGSRLNIQPTIEIRAGYPFNIIVSKDIVFEAPYAYGYARTGDGDPRP